MSVRQRTAQLRRKTKETNIAVKLNLDGQGKAIIETGIPFLNHMLELLTKHGLFDLAIKAKGDLHVDRHHTNEDVGLLLGEAFKKALGDKRGIRRFGSISLPMDEAIANVAVDLSGRPKLVFTMAKGSETGSREELGYTLSDAQHFLESFANAFGITLHVETKGGRDLHHILEAAFKGLGIALGHAVERNPRIKGVPSTKGKL